MQTTLVWGAPKIERKRYFYRMASSHSIEKGTRAYSKSFGRVTLCQNQSTLIRGSPSSIIGIIQFWNASNTLTFGAIVFLEFFALLEVGPCQNILHYSTLCNCINQCSRVRHCQHLSKSCILIIHNAYSKCI